LRVRSHLVDPRFVGERFYYYGFGQLRAETQAGIANHANKIWLSANELYLLVFAKTEFAQPFGDLRRSGQFLNADSSARNHPAQGAMVRMAVAATVN
jgi:hypothetical protein